MRGSELRYRGQRAKRHWMGWALRRADRVIAVSDGLRGLAIELGVNPHRATTIPNGIDADMFCRRDRAACRLNHGLAPDERIVLCAGDLAELKGHHRVIRAVTALNQAGVATRLLIAGGTGRSGRYAEALRREVQATAAGAWVRFVGEVRQPILAELMSAADVFCLASSTEGWPNVVHEALACGTPVVATDVGAVRQMVPSEQYGSVVPVDDVAALTAALSVALTREWDATAIAAHGASRSWRRVAGEVLEQAREAVGGRVESGRP
jgi:teichuronic acid biosynthesis glycosyltransferase TuaC